jgi:hypothetical protein
MISILFWTIYFYYIASLLIQGVFFISGYISEKYLFVVAQNIGFLKRFAGL